MATDTDELPPPHARHTNYDPSYNHHRPEFPRRGGSLLDRLSLEDPKDEVHLQQSLRERVEVPSKRDRDDMLSDRYAGEETFDEDDPASKKARKKTTKVRKVRRGGS